MKIIHPTDFSDCAEQARGLAVQLARALGAELVLLHVAVEGPLFREGLVSTRQLERVFEEQRDWARRALEERAVECRGQGIPTLAHVVTGVPADAIVTTAKREGAAFIVMGTHGRGALERFFLGSVADRVVRGAPCAVVTRCAASAAPMSETIPWCGTCSRPTRASRPAASGRARSRSHQPAPKPSGAGPFPPDTPGSRPTRRQDPGPTAPSGSA